MSGRHSHLPGRCPDPDCHSHGGQCGSVQEWEEEIRHHLGPDYVVLGLGSSVKGDDGAGSEVARRLKEKGRADAMDCGTAPENYIAKVGAMAPSDVLFVDAVDFGGEPGEIAFFGGARFDPQSVSTHSAGLSPLMEFLSRSCDAACWVLAIQPQELGFCDELSEPVRAAVERIVESPVWSE